MKTFNIIKILFLSMLLFYACDDFLTTPPLDSITDDNWWSSKSQVEMMVNSCYSELYGPDDVVLHDCITDNAIHRSHAMVAVGNGTYDTQNGYVLGKWKYSSIAKLNYVLGGIEKAKDFVTEDEYMQFTAQVRFIRAFVYYDMIFYFGDIPLITKVLTVSESRDTSRQPRAEVLSFILKELEEYVLPNIETIPVTGTGRINEDVVNAYLARIYLHEKKFDKVIEYTDKIINSKRYDLNPDYDALFRPQADGNNKEVIFERQYSSPLYVHALNRNLSPVSSVYVGWSHVSPLQNLVDDYECINGHSIHECESLNCEYHQKRIDIESETVRGEYQFRDPRLGATIMWPFWEWKKNGEVVSVYGVDDPNSKDYLKAEPHQSGFLVTKWVDLEGENPDRTRAEKNMTIIRYADVLLMKAEALIEKNQDLEVAIALINKIRTRAGMPANVSLSSQNQLRETLRHERRVETALEGLRYYDIIRWRIGDEVKKGKALGARLKAISETMENKFMENRYWEDKMYLFPIPQNAIDLNPNLVQNPSW